MPFTFELKVKDKKLRSGTSATKFSMKVDKKRKLSVTLLNMEDQVDKLPKKGSPLSS